MPKIWTDRCRSYHSKFLLHSAFENWKCHCQTCFRIFCSLISFCRSRLALLITTSSTCWPLLMTSATKKTTSSNSLMANLKQQSRMTLEFKTEIRNQSTEMIIYDWMSVLKYLKTNCFHDSSYLWSKTFVSLKRDYGKDTQTQTHTYTHTPYRRSFWLMNPWLNCSTTVLSMALASLAKSRSLISITGTETMAKASLSSLVGHVPNWKKESC